MAVNIKIIEGRRLLVHGIMSSVTAYMDDVYSKTVSSFDGIEAASPYASSA